MCVCVCARVRVCACARVCCGLCLHLHCVSFSSTYLCLPAHQVYNVFSNMSHVNVPTAVCSAICLTWLLLVSKVTNSHCCGHECVSRATFPLLLTACCLFLAAYFLPLAACRALKGDLLSSHPSAVQARALDCGGGGCALHEICCRHIRSQYRSSGLEV